MLRRHAKPCAVLTLTLVSASVACGTPPAVRSPELPQDRWLVAEAPKSTSAEVSLRPRRAEDAVGWELSPVAEDELRGVERRPWFRGPGRYALRVRADDPALAPLEVELALQLGGDERIVRVWIFGDVTPGYASRLPAPWRVEVLLMVPAPDVHTRVALQEGRSQLVIVNRGATPLEPLYGDRFLRWWVWADDSSFLPLQSESGAYEWCGFGRDPWAPRLEPGGEHELALAAVSPPQGAAAKGAGHAFVPVRAADAEPEVVRRGGDDQVSWEVTRAYVAEHSFRLAELPRVPRQDDAEESE